MLKSARVRGSVWLILGLVVLAMLWQSGNFTNLLNDAEPTVSAASLPRQGQETLRRIRAGGPFPFDKDGTVFVNRERLLPARQRGYYREYTVKTSGARGARRIVCGGARPTTPDVCYYTQDHYASFKRIEQQ